MKLIRHEAGFTAWELVLVLVVLVGIVAVGMHVYDSHVSVGSTATTITGSGNALSSTSKSTMMSVPTAPQVTSTADLNSALNTLNQVNPSGSDARDTSQLNSQSNF